MRLDATMGRLMGQWRLQDPRLSLRHLAWGPDGKTLGIALQMSTTPRRMPYGPGACPV